MDGVGRGVRSRGRLGFAARADAFRQLHRHGHQQRRHSVPNVEVVATNEATQVTYTATQQRRGPLHDLGAAHRHVQGPGAGGELPALRDQSDQARVGPERARRHHDARSGPASRSRSPRVSPILQTQDAVVGEVISETTIERMPLNGRNFSQLSLLLPGVMTTAPDTFTEPKNFGAGRPYVNGQREQENNYTLDGVDMNEPIDNLLPYQPSPDALAEVRVETNNYSAEFGNVAGAVIGSTIKSGTNDFHGNRFEVLARQQHGRQLVGQQPRPAPKKSELSQHIFGGTIGGPIVRNKLFFFGDYQASSATGRASRWGRWRPEAWRRGDFSGVGVTIRDPRTGLPFPGNQITVEPVQPDRARGARQPDSCIRCRTGRATRTTWSRPFLTSSAPIRATPKST